MSKKIISQVFITLLMLGLYSCGNNGNKSVSGEEILDSTFVHVSSIYSFSMDDLSLALKNFVRVDNGDYLLEDYGNNGLKLTIIFKGHSLGNHDEAMAQLSGADLELALLDDNNTDFCNERFRLDGISFQKLLEWTKASRLNDKKEVTFVCPKVSDIKKVKERAKKAKFYVTGSSSYGDSDMSDSSDDDEEVSESSSGSEDWDAILDSYERMVDKYVTYANKVADGNTNVMSEAASIMEEAQEYADKLKKADDNLSSSQLSRLNRISAKMAKAAAELQMKMQ